MVGLTQYILLLHRNTEQGQRWKSALISQGFEVVWET
jgi:hypothetical protein